MYDLANCQSRNLKKIEPVEVVNLTINAANCNVLNMIQCVHCLGNNHNQSTAICPEIMRVDIKVEYFCDNIVYHYPTSVLYMFFCKCNARNLVWNWYGSMEDCLPFLSWNLPFHSILASSIFHTEIPVPIHSIPCPAWQFVSDVEDDWLTQSDYWKLCGRKVQRSR